MGLTLNFFSYSCSNIHWAVITSCLSTSKIYSDFLIIGLYLITSKHHQLATCSDYFRSNVCFFIIDDLLCSFSLTNWCDSFTITSRPTFGLVLLSWMTTGLLCSFSLLPVQFFGTIHFYKLKFSTAHWLTVVRSCYLHLLENF